MGFPKTTMGRRVVISATDLDKTYRETKIPVHALRGVSLEIRQEEFTAIVGPSGSGKTTLLNMIGGLDQPDSGKVIIAGHDISKLSENQLIDFRKNNIGFVFQSYNLIPVLTALENVAFVMLLQGINEKERKNRATALLEKVGLGDKLHNRPLELSGGQQQRVAVARALASQPTFVLADEPTANLDSRSTTQLLDIMASLNEEQNMTFVFSTHDNRVVERARRVVTLVDGKIESDEEFIR